MDITFISRLFKNLFYYFKSWQCTGQDHQIKSIYLHNLYSRIPKCDCSEKGWHGFDGCFDEFRCRRSGAAVVLLREQANQRQSCLQGIFMGVLDETRRVLWSVCPSPPSGSERVPVVQFTTHACETESHAALPLYHLPPWSTPSNTYGLSGCIGGQRVILQLAQWSGVSVPSSSLSLCASRLTRSNSIKVWGFWMCSLGDDDTLFTILTLWKKICAR